MIPIHLVPQPTVTIVGEPVNTGFLRGEPLDLVCSIKLINAVDSTVMVEEMWSRNGSLLTSNDGVTDVKRVQDNPPLYQTSIYFHSLQREDSGKYNCTACIVPQDPNYIFGACNQEIRSIIVGSEFNWSNYSITNDFIKL